MKLEKCSAIRLETLNHAIVTNPNGVEYRISHWEVNVENIHEILVVMTKENDPESILGEEVTLSWNSIKDWSIQLQTEGYRIA